MGQIAQRGPVFDLPLSPEDGSRTASGLVRIVDSAGCAVAWFDPGTARCAGFMVQSPAPGRGTWRPVFDHAETQATVIGMAQSGALAVPSDSVSQITSGERGEEWPAGAWRLLQRDPTSVILQTTLHCEGDSGVRRVDTRLVAQLDDATLSLALTLHNDETVVRPVAFGLRVTFSAEVAKNGLLLAQGGKTTPLHMPSGRDPDGFAAISDRTPHIAQGGDRAKPVSAARVVVTCDGGVHHVETRVIEGEGRLALLLGGSAPGEPVHLLPGTHVRAKVSLATGYVSAIVPAR